MLELTGEYLLPTQRALPRNADFVIYSRPWGRQRHHPVPATAIRFARGRMLTDRVNVGDALFYARVTAPLVPRAPLQDPVAPRAVMAAYCAPEAVLAQGCLPPQLQRCPLHSAWRESQGRFVTR